jgi:hypothetical protein
VDENRLPGQLALHHSGMGSAGGKVYEMATIRPSGKPLTGNQWAQTRFRGLIVANHPNDALNWLVTAI